MRLFKVSEKPPNRWRRVWVTEYRAGPEIQLTMMTARQMPGYVDLEHAPPYTTATENKCTG